MLRQITPSLARSRIKAGRKTFLSHELGYLTTVLVLLTEIRMTSPPLLLPKLFFSLMVGKIQDHKYEKVNS